MSRSVCLEMTCFAVTSKLLCGSSSVLVLVGSSLCGKNTTVEYDQKALFRLTSRCFGACVPEPGWRLNNKEVVCLWRCTERYLDTQELVQEHWAEKIQSGAWDLSRGPAGTRPP